jgi:hypothetical protein
MRPPSGRSIAFMASIAVVCRPEYRIAPATCTSTVSTRLVMAACTRRAPPMMTGASSAGTYQYTRFSTKRCISVPKSQQLSPASTWRRYAWAVDDTPITVATRNRSRLGMVSR